MLFMGRPMASIYIRDVDDRLVRELRMKALSDGITLKALVVPLLEHAVNSNPVEYKRKKP
jgi:hypothetical protein